MARNQDFIREIIEADLETGKNSGKVITRFPPEPNGYLHIGHAKSICLNFGIAEEYGGTCHLRFDDTNPDKEDQAYIDAIRQDIHWLGFDWGEQEFHAADYFEKMYAYAEDLVRAGMAYVDDSNAEEIRRQRGTLTEPGRESPWRNRSVEENLELLRRMRRGDFPDGDRVLRAKIDMASPNLNMRDPTLYRIRRATHHRTGDSWCIYPMYDFAHCLEDAIEGITHSICTLEFEDHRPLYDWVLDNLPVPCHPQQIEFARLNLTHTVMSKRKLLTLVEKNLVGGWDDPRLPTLAGLRRRGYTPESIRNFCRRIGVAKRDSTVAVELLEHCLREDLNLRANRAMAVLDPLKVVIVNYPEDKTEKLEAVNNPEDPAAGNRLIPFGREIYIERRDFMEDPPKKFHRLSPGREVRLRYGYFITCQEVIRNDAGEIRELRCTYDPATRGGYSPDGRKVKGTIHWVSAPHSIPGEIRLYDRLFSCENPAGSEDWLTETSPDSLQVIAEARLEPGLVDKPPGWFCQFERVGYFVVDPDSRPGRPVFNRSVGLRDTWAKIAGRTGGNK